MGTWLKKRDEVEREMKRIMTGKTDFAHVSNESREKRDRNSRTISSVIH